MNKRRRVAQKKRRKTRERMKAKEKGLRPAGATPAAAASVGTRRTATS